MGNERWFYKVDDEKHGPLPGEELASMFAQGTLGGSTQVWRHGMQGWVPARECAEFTQAINSAGPSKKQTQRGGVWKSGSGDGWTVRRPIAGVGTLMLIVLAISWFGSSRKPVVFGVNGTLAYEGKPVENGQVVFEPQSDAGQMRTAVVKSGVFSLPKKEGLPKDSTFVIRAYGYRMTGEKYENNDVSQSAEIQEQFLPPHFNSSSELRFETTKANLRAGLTLDLR